MSRQTVTPLDCVMLCMRRRVCSLSRPPGLTHSLSFTEQTRWAPHNLKALRLNNDRATSARVVVPPCRSCARLRGMEGAGMDVPVKIDMGPPPPWSQAFRHRLAFATTRLRCDFMRISEGSDTAFQVGQRLGRSLLRSLELIAARDA